MGRTRLLGGIWKKTAVLGTLRPGMKSSWFPVLDSLGSAVLEPHLVGKAKASILAPTTPPLRQGKQPAGGMLRRPGSGQAQSWLRVPCPEGVAAHLYLGLGQAGDSGQVLSSADVRIGPCCKHPLQLQQLPNTEGDPFSPVWTQLTGMVCGGWE